MEKNNSSIRVRLSWVGLGILFGFFLGGGLFGGDIYSYKDSADLSQLPQVDAIVCLAGGRGRIAAAGDVWARYWQLNHQKSGGHPEDSQSGANLMTPVLYLSGMGRQANWVDVSPQLKREVLQLIRPENVVVENESSNTDSNARWLVKYAQEKGWKRILLITSSYHMKRARYIFGQVLNKTQSPLVIETLSFYQEPYDSESWRESLQGIRVTLTEYLKWLYYRWIWTA